VNVKAIGTPARVALMGFGTVGQSVARILCSGEVPQVQLTHIFNRDVNRKRVDWVPSSVTWTDSAADIIPVLRALQEGLAGDRLVEVRGILNGTCAYILSRMQNEAISFADALTDAQKLGYAEADPSEDLDGADAAAKLAIIAAVGLRRPVRVGDIATRSIRPIEAVDFMYARELGCTIRQIARASAEDNGEVFAAVRPALVPLTSNFGRIEGSQNIVTVRGIFGGETSFSGSGAGGSPTAVAVVSDVLSVAGHGDLPAAQTEPTAYHKVRGDFVAPHYVRFTVNDKPGILAAITNAYAKYGINIEGVLQLPKFRRDRLPFVTTLEECPESVLDRALAEVAKSDYHVQPPLALPIFA